MPRTVLAVENISRAGLNPTTNAADATNNHEIQDNDGTIFLRINNGGAGACQVDAVPSILIDGLTVPDKSISVPAGANRYFGPFRKDYYNQPTNNAVYIDIDVDTSVTIECLRCPKS